jgi:hypothetical protein
MGVVPQKNNNIKKYEFLSVAKNSVTDVQTPELGWRQSRSARNSVHLT